MNKKDIRSEMVIKRDSIERNAAAELSDRIRKRVLSLDEFKSSEDVFLYCSFRSEVDTRKLIEDTIEVKGKVYLPKVVSRTKMIFVKISSIDDLKKGFRGIFEPAGNEESSVIPGLILVPLLAYDLNGIRLGYGGGYYDRTMPLYKGKSLLAALAFEEQCYKSLPCDETDIKMDAIITPEEVIRIR